MSKALLKSRAKTTTNQLVDNRLVTDCSIAIRSAVVDPVGRKAYWLSKLRVVGGERIAGYTFYDYVLQRTGVIEIGRKSECSTGVEFFFSTGRIEAYFHCRGTTDVTMDFSNRRAMGLQKIGAPRRRNQAGRQSKPVAVLVSLSRIVNICHSEMTSIS